MELTLLIFAGRLQASPKMYWSGNWCEWEEFAWM